MNTIDETGRDKNPASAGFSLMEVVVAGFLLVLGFLAISRLVIGMMGGADLSRHTMEATGIAQGKIEDLLASGFDAASNGTETVDGYYTLAWTSTVSSVSSIKDISVTTEWTDHRGKQHSVELKTMLSEDRMGIGSMSFTNIPIFAP